MFNVILVDDDYPVIEYLVKCVPWEELGLHLLGAYEDGEKAYAQVKRCPPDILITDIGMPRMNGLELIEKVRQLRAETKVAILSCHNEFEYAQRAVKLNVSDYILKETMEVDQFVEMLLHIKEELLQRKKVRHISEQNRSLLKEKFIHSTLEHPIIHPEQWHQKARVYGLDFAGFSYLPVHGLVDRYEEARKRFVSDDNFIFAVENVVNEIADEAGNVVVFRLTPHSLLLFIAMQSTIGGLTKAESVIGDIQVALKQYLRVSLTVLVGRPVNDLPSLRSHVQPLVEEASDIRFYAEAGSTIHYAPMEFAEGDLFAHYAEASEQFKQMVLHQCSDDLVPGTTHWMKLIRAQRFRPAQVKEWFLKLALDLQLKFKTMQHFRTDYSLEKLHNRVLEAESLDQLQEILIHVMQEAISIMDHIYQQPQRKEIMEAKQYIRRNLNSKISLGDVAKHLHLNTSYFSRLFKKETGENFVEYVTRLKMEKAKELIDQSGLTVEEVSSTLGYDNKSYFLKCFKTYTGLTPSEYAGRAR